MNVNEVPQEANATLGGRRKVVYARDKHGQLVSVACPGWEVEEIVTLQAVEAHQALADAALLRARVGESSTLEYWMYAKRMDRTILAQSSGFWQWRVRRHLQPKRFANLADRLALRYAAALGLSLEQLRSLP